MHRYSSTSPPTGVTRCSPDGRIQLHFPPRENVIATAQPVPPLRHPHDRIAVETSAVQRPPVMRICIIIVGTRGDVQPFLAIAKRLQADGHRVRLATHAVYRDFVMSHGVEFYPLGGDPKELAAYMVKTGGHLIPTKIETLTKDVPRNKEMIKEIVHSTWPAVSAADPDGGGPGVPGALFQAQAIIANPVSYGHIHVAERLGVPLHIMFPQPWVPTTAFPHPLANMPYTDEIKKNNYLSYKMVDLLMWQGTEGIINDFRTKVLKLRKIRNGDGGRDLLLDLKIPHAFMWSPRLVPKPADWGDLYDVIGTVTLNSGPDSSYTPSPELTAFLSVDSGPIFVGFGSMVLVDPPGTTKMIIDAAAQANVRVLIQSSWSDMAGDLDIPDNVFFLGNCPHDWLMPRVSAVVHHGGAGTTAAGLLAGKPTFIVPFFGDQPFWGHAVVAAGVGVEPCPIAQLTTEKLRVAFVGLMNPTLHARALELRDIMCREDGAGEAVRSFYRHLPTPAMWCDLDHERIATRWSPRDRLKMCDRCARIISERPGNERKKMISYHCVDYTARGPESTLEGATSGSGAFFHEFAGAYTSLIREPVKGFSDSGLAGGALGTLKGVGGFLLRPTAGLALFTDRVITGHINAHREEGQHKQSSLLGRRAMAAVGLQRGLADSYSSPLDPNAIDTVIFQRKHDRKKMLHGLSDAVIDSYRGRYEAAIDYRSNLTARLFGGKLLHSDCHGNSWGGVKPKSMNSSPSAPSWIGKQLSLHSIRLTAFGSVEVSIDLANAAENAVDKLCIAKWQAFSSYQHNKMGQLLRANRNLPVPSMNISMAAIGTWDNGVKQFVAIGLKLVAHGHRVRLAANECFRSKITAHGLEFYPLVNAPESTQEFASLVYNAQAECLDASHGGSNLGACQAFRELIYSLWPAACGSDPHGGGDNVAGEYFRADTLLWHPVLLGHAHVAERLGIPFQCASLDPLSPTFEFPHVLSSILGLDTVTMAPQKSNLLTHGAADAIFCHGIVADVMNQFRAFIGLANCHHQSNPLVEWEVPHIYLYSPALLQKPVDWGAELAVVGHVTLQDEGRCLPRALADFVVAGPNVPVIYFGLSMHIMTSGEIEDMLQNISIAVQQLQVRTIVQIQKGESARFGPPESDWTYLAENDISYSQIFPHVAATIHCGEADVLAEGLKAGKPVAVCGSHPVQSFTATMCERSGVGIPLINPAVCSFKSLTRDIRLLLQPELRQNARALAQTFDSEQALNAAVQAFYSNLPLPAMQCDVDPSKIARVFDSHHDVKLSLETYLAVEPVRDESKGFVPYKPLLYGGSRPPTFSIRGIPGEVPHDVRPSREIDSIGIALDVLDAQDESRTSSTRSSSGSFSRYSNPELFWTSREEEESVRKLTNAAYDRLVKPKEARKRDKLARLFSKQP